MTGQERQRIPEDDGVRQPVLAAAGADRPDLVHLAIGAQTYTVLIGGEQTLGRYALIDMLVPPGGGTPLHRHTFDEMFHILEGEIEVNVRGRPYAAAVGDTLNVPALAAHAYRNPTEQPARMLCMVTPAGLEDYLAQFGDRLPERTSPLPALGDDEVAARRRRAEELGPAYGVEVLHEPG